MTIENNMSLVTILTEEIIEIKNRLMVLEKAYYSQVKINELLKAEDRIQTNKINQLGNEIAYSINCRK